MFSNYNKPENLNTSFNYFKLCIEQKINVRWIIVSRVTVFVDCLFKPLYIPSTWIGRLLKNPRCARYNDEWCSKLGVEGSKYENILPACYITWESMSINHHYCILLNTLQITQSKFLICIKFKEVYQNFFIRT